MPVAAADLQKYDSAPFCLRRRVPLRLVRQSTSHSPKGDSLHEQYRNLAVAMRQLSTAPLGDPLADTSEQKTAAWAMPNRQIAAWAKTVASRADYTFAVAIQQQLSALVAQHDDPMAEAIELSTEAWAEVARQIAAWAHAIPSREFYVHELSQEFAVAMQQLSALVAQHGDPMAEAIERYTEACAMVNRQIAGYTQAVQGYLEGYNQQVDLAARAMRQLAAIRQPTLSVAPALHPLPEQELESPNFVPPQLVAFVAAGYVRRNRWA